MVICGISTIVFFAAAVYFATRPEPPKTYEVKVYEANQSAGLPPSGGARAGGVFVDDGCMSVMQTPYNGSLLEEPVGLDPQCPTAEIVTI